MSDDGSTASAGWRLPAPDLEWRAALAVITHLEKALPRELGAVLQTDQLEIALAKLRSDAHLLDRADESTMRRVLILVHHAKINRDTITIRLDDAAFAEMLSSTTGQLPATMTTIETPFAIKRRGVEAKMIIGSVPEQHLDRTLLNNITQGHEWYAALKAGASFDDLAKASGQSKQRMTQIMELAFLSPAIITAIARGQQPVGLTSDYLFRTRIPSDWAEQKKLIDVL